MVIDSSALVAIFLREAERDHFLNLILSTKTRLISALSYVETGIVLEGRRGKAASSEWEKVLNEISVEIVAVDTGLAQDALAAWRKYGKGRHPAGLNLGDCFSYALSRSSGEPLLAKGNDFARTDLVLCPQSPPTQ
jgi:ribonuclease VapC